MEDDGWGYAIMSDGSTIPLVEPPALIPEEHRRVIYKSDRCTMWVDKREDNNGQDK